MTVKTDFIAIAPSATAKAAVAKGGSDIASLQALLNQKIVELQITLKALIAVYPNTDGDAAAYTALSTVLAELA